MAIESDNIRRYFLWVFAGGNNMLSISKRTRLQARTVALNGHFGKSACANTCEWFAGEGGRSVETNIMA